MQDRLSWRTKIVYGFGDTGFSLTTTIVAAYFAIFLTDVVGISPGTAAIAIFAGNSWDYINDPIIGHLSDRTRTRWGRRRPFLLFDEMARRARQRGYRWLDLSLNSDDNPRTPALAGRFGAKIYKRYRVYRINVT